ncbi:VOC family protein [Micromonosporaceae bacterium B7E4]
MGQQVVHFEIIGTDPAALRSYYGELFGWQFGVGDAATEAVSAPGEYGFVDASATGDGTGINGGVGGGAGYQRRVLFYVGVPDVEAALRRAESLGGTRVLGPAPASGGPLAVGHFTDPEGNLIGVAGPPR